MDTLTLSDLQLINSLSSREFTENRLLSNASEEEYEQLRVIKRKLRGIAEYFANKYNTDYGPFETSISSGNPIAIGGTRFNRVWAGLFKGNTNKQYAAQISFVMNPDENCLDVGFYFGRASGHNLTAEQRIDLETTLNNLGIMLSDGIINDNSFRNRYEDLFDFGFSAYSNGNIVLADDWYNIIRTDTRNSQIIAKIYPNNFNIIENSTIDFYVSQVIFLMGAITNNGAQQGQVKINPQTPEQIAKRAERLAQIGLDGEVFVLNYERQRLQEQNLIRDGYPRHVALESTHYGYDILSLDTNGNDIYIEVKTTTRSNGAANSRRFFISNNEIEVFENNRTRYKLYRVYSVYNSPSFEELDLANLNKWADGYIVEY